LDRLIDRFVDPDLLVEGKFGRRFGRQIIQNGHHELEAVVYPPVHGGPKVLVAQPLQIDAFGPGDRGGQFQKRAHGVDRVADLPAEAGGDDAHAEDPVGDHQPMNDRELFPQQSVTLHLNGKELDAALERHFQVLGIPGLGDILVDGAGVHRPDGRIQIREGRRQNADDLGSQPPGPFQELHSLFTRHPLVGHHHGDFILMIVQETESSRGIRCCQDPECARKRAGKVLQRHLLVVNVKNDKPFVVVHKIDAPA
jgi:hypothetical protein